MTHELNDGKSSVLLRGGRTFSRWRLLKRSEVLVGEPLKGVLRTWHLFFSLLSLLSCWDHSLKVLVPGSLEKPGMLTVQDCLSNGKDEKYLPKRKLRLEVIDSLVI